jgi:DNA invertase Pin-like site-specific DNA recombinase
VANIVMSVAERECEIISERTAEALAEVKDSGKQLGRPILIEDATIKKGRRLRAKGHTLRAIADQLNADGVPTAHGGGRWHSSTLRGVLRRSGGDPRARTRARVA